MPRDGSNIYSQPFPDVVEDTTIESTVYNGFTNDIAADLNAPRPIVAGGTGATNADQALVNLGGEKAAMLVTNYDSHVWQAGSFYSAGSATGGPVDGHAFSGIAYGSDPVATPPANQNVVLEARDVTDNKLYVRRKTAGTWAAWSSEESGYDARFVNVTGDTMTGDLSINSATGSPTLTLNKITPTQSNDINGFSNSLPRWKIRLGDDASESGSNAGSNYSVTRYNDAGAAIDTPLSIARASGVTTLANSVNLTTGSVNANNGALRSNISGSGTVYFGPTDTKYLSFDGTKFNLGGGDLSSTGNITATGNLAVNNITGSIITGSQLVSKQTSGQPLMQLWDNGRAISWGVYNATDNRLSFGTTDGVGAVTGRHMYIETDGSVHVLTNYIKSYVGTSSFVAINSPNIATTGIALTQPPITIANTGSGSSFAISSTGQPILSFFIPSVWGANFGLSADGNFYMGGWSHGANAYKFWTTKDFASVPSDYRIKKDVTDLPGMWDTVKALRPIKYTHCDFTPPALLESYQREGSGDHEPYVKADDIERWGFIAHELQETLIENAAHAPKDDPDLIQAPNPFTVIAALTKALQEAMARIEALEARV